ncbi:uncharacterized protein LOC132249846 [Alligator mississippiensis]|uniref:uncharacterized protein LOC132249846 n=1 Tax=Alligator mississippiensis TaxID=8496 RepID=UPI002877B36B|nr:uncharacterized protein LOC132249846 [Alligator mississippiensis]
MYFFLGHLSFLDMSYSSVTVPKILVNFVRQRETISYRECMAQMFFLMTCAGTECALLTVMAFDRYAAICKPLHYTRIMSKKVCVSLATACWLWGILASAIHTFLATDVSFCGDNQIHHIFCDVPPLLKIACSDTYINVIALHAATVFVGLSPFLLVLISYLYILAAILRMHSRMGRGKAFSTCTSHLVVVIIYFGMANLNYNRPSTGYSLEVDTLISTLYCIITPMLNPLIYSLRNQDVRGALKKVLGYKRRDCVSTHGESGPDSGWLWRDKEYGHLCIWPSEMAAKKATSVSTFMENVTLSGNGSLQKKGLSMEGAPHVLVAEAVDEGVEHGGEDAVQCGDKRVHLRRVATAGPVVVQVRHPKVDGDHDQVGGAGGEGFAPARVGADAEDGQQDVEVAATGPMDGANQTQVTEFIFLGFSHILQGQAFLFLAFLTVYLITLLGNCLILTLIVLDPQLHSPMYFFLGHLAFLDMCYSSVTLPKILINFVRQQETISYRECMAQMFFLIICTGTECALLTVMAFDRYAAICKPLHYTRIMSKKVCVPLATACWLWGILNSTMHTSLATDVSFCAANQIHHIFCDVPPLLKIACSDTYINEMALHAASVFVGLIPFLLILISYTYILLAILRIRSNTGRRKAFSTCAAHLVVVIMYFGMAILNYNKPSAGYSLEVDTLVSALYCILPPMLNPLIYSLRNQDVKGALRRALGHHEKDNASPHAQPGVD